MRLSQRFMLVLSLSQVNNLDWLLLPFLEPGDYKSFPHPANGNTLRPNNSFNYILLWQFP
jgi:hypothetical protein